MSDIRSEVSSVGWYHTIDLPGGVVTPGMADLRSVRPRIPIPRLEGKRCLDVGSATGYWAFELERMGASEVVSFDLDDKRLEDRAAGQQADPEWFVGIATRGFEIAKRHLNSKVARVDGSVYDLSPELVGSFDFVFVGSLLLHLRDPVRALAAVRSVCHGTLLSFDMVSPMLSAVFPRLPIYGMWSSDIQQWWIPNQKGHRHMIEVAGFRVLDHGAGLRQQLGPGYRRQPIWEARSVRQMAGMARVRRGAASQWVLAAPHPQS